MNNLQEFMKWFNTDFCVWWKSEYRADYINNYKAIQIKRTDYFSNLMLGSPIIEIVEKAKELELTICFECELNNPIIEIS